MKKEKTQKKSKVKRIIVINLTINFNFSRKKRMKEKIRKNYVNNKIKIIIFYKLSQILIYLLIIFLLICIFNLEILSLSN